MLPFLLLSVGCAGQQQVRYVPVERCSVPTARLQPTPEPGFRDATNRDLLLEIDGEGGWRESLRACNRDKADTERLIEFSRRKAEGVPK